MALRPGLDESTIQLSPTHNITSDGQLVITADVQPVRPEATSAPAPPAGSLKLPDNPYKTDPKRRMYAVVAYALANGRKFSYFGQAVDLPDFQRRKAAWNARGGTQRNDYQQAIAMVDWSVKQGKKIVEAGGWTLPKTTSAVITLPANPFNTDPQRRMYAVVAYALANGRKFSYFGQAVDLQDFLRRKAAHNAKGGKQRTNYDQATAMVGWSIKQGKKIVEAGGWKLPSAAGGPTPVVAPTPVGPSSMVLPNNPFINDATKARMYDVLAYALRHKQLYTYFGKHYGIKHFNATLASKNKVSRPQITPVQHAMNMVNHSVNQGQVIEEAGGWSLENGTNTGVALPTGHQEHHDSREIKGPDGTVIAYTTDKGVVFMEDGFVVDETAVKAKPGLIRRNAEGNITAVLHEPSGRWLNLETNRWEPQATTAAEQDAEKQLLELELKNLEQGEIGDQRPKSETRKLIEKAVITGAVGFGVRYLFGDVLGLGSTDDGLGATPKGRKKQQKRPAVGQTYTYTI